MSLQPQAIPPVPEETARVARAILPKGNAFIHMRDEFGTFFRDEDFLDLFSEKGQPAESAWRLALVMVMQYAEGLTDRQAADAVRTRIDWKYALSLEITDPGFDFSVLSEFRSRLLANQAERRLFDVMLSQFRERGWVKERGKQRTDSTHVLAAIRAVNRLECVGETMRHALNILAEVAPDWLIEHMQPEWAKRYQSRFSDFRLPKEEKARVELAEEIGADGRDLLENVYTSSTHTWLGELPALEILRRIWMQQYHASEQGTPWRKDQELAPSALLISSPYDSEARYSKKKNTRWVGYKVHFTEGCDPDQPHFLLEITTTAATTPDGAVLEDLHERLAEKKVLPSQHLVDKGYVDAEILAASVNNSITLILLALYSLIPVGHQKKLGALITATFSLIGRQKVFSALLDKRVEIGGISPIGTESRVFVYGFLFPSVECVLFMLNAHKLRRKCLFCVQMNRPIRHFKKRVNVRKLLNSGHSMRSVLVLKARLRKRYGPVKCEEHVILDRKR